MDQLAIRRVIAENLRRGNVRFAEDALMVRRDPYVGWRLAVISEDFSGMSFSERRRLALAGLENEVIQWADLLTPEESMFSGDLLVDAIVEDLPLWPEALAKPTPTQPIVFPSDLDIDLESPIVTTFYSLRGGVGRSTALAYTAQLLARRGKSVLCVDLDLEAPGLAALFGKEGELQSGKGLLSVLTQLDQGETPDLVEHLIRVTESLELYVLPAGVPDADYARRLRLVDPESWYQQEQNPLRRFLSLINELPFRPDIVLMDARTGISPISGPLLFDLSDIAVVAFFPHPQAEKGTRALTQALLKAKSHRKQIGSALTPEPRFLISPVPPREVERYLRRSEEWIEDWLRELNATRRGAGNDLEPRDILHLLPYREVIATSDQVIWDDDVLKMYEPVANWLERLLPSKSESTVAQVLPKVKSTILQQLAFSAGTAEMQDNFLSTFVPTEVFKKAADPGRPLIVGRKGTGKTAFFRWLLESPDYRSIVVSSAASLRTYYPWALSPDAFGTIHSTLKANNRAGWREFWVLYTALACYHSLRREGLEPPMPRPELSAALDNVLGVMVFSELVYIESLQRALAIPSVGLLAWDWLAQLDSSLHERRFLLFDGLDTGFGNSEAERNRRKEALEELFTMLLDREQALSQLKFKALLREDIWTKLRFENKSHLAVRTVRLEWKNESDYAKTILKQALQSETFRTLAEDLIKPVRYSPVEQWPEESVFQAWNLLVGERMKGTKSTYTINWVWNRLADGNGDHSPRSLFHLFNRAAEWEKQEQRTNPYDRSVVRSRALVVALEDVSGVSLDSLLEEFSELKPLATKLKSLGRSPVEADQLKNGGKNESWSDVLSLAHEVGLLDVYEENERGIRRYRVPDLYRIALEMTRKGQA